LPGYVSEILKITEQVQEHWLRLGLLPVFGVGTLFWSAITVLFELNW